MTSRNPAAANGADEKIWEPIDKLEIMAVNAEGELCDDDTYSCTVIGHALKDVYGYSLIEICTGTDRQTDMELAQLVLAALKAGGQDEVTRLRKALQFYANRNHWMGITERGDHSNLVAHGPHFDGTNNGWVEAETALTELAPAAAIPQVLSCLLCGYVGTLKVWTDPAYATDGNLRGVCIECYEKWRSSGSVQPQ